MASRLPSVLPIAEKSSRPSFKEGVYGVPDTMIYGPTAVLDETVATHPLALSEKKFQENRTQMDFAMLKRVQGMHAPMRITMERRAASMVGRLPFLASSNAMLEALAGTDETVGFEDIFNVPSENEAMINPHLAMERSYGFV